MFRGRTLARSVAVVAVLVATAAHATAAGAAPPTPVVGQSESFDPAAYDAYVQSTASTRKEKDALSDLAASARSSGDWTAFDAAANGRDTRLGRSARKRVDHSIPVTTGLAAASADRPAAILFNFRYVAGVTQFPQTTTYYCGPAAGQAILAGWSYAGVSFARGAPSQAGLAGAIYFRLLFPANLWL